MISTPSLAFSPRLVEAEEPVGMEALGAELAVQRLDEGVGGRFARATEVECDIAHEGPEIELLADELRPTIETDGLGQPMACAARSRVATTSVPRYCCRTSIAGESRVKVSTMVSTRIFLPSKSRSWTKAAARPGSARRRIMAGTRSAAA